MGVLATCLFYGDAMITPAVTLLPAVEGLAIAEAGLQPLILPITIALLIGLFVVQRRGTARVGRMFGPIIVIYLGVLAALGPSDRVVLRPVPVRVDDRGDRAGVVEEGLRIADLRREPELVDHIAVRRPRLLMWIWYSTLSSNS